MAKAPSLISLCMKAVKSELLRGDYILPAIYELPSHLFDALLAFLPPLALQKLQREMPLEKLNDYDESLHDYVNYGRKRKRNGNFNAAWKSLFESRWPLYVEQIKSDDWQQIYWETHLQNCLDEAAAVASLPSFNGSLGEIKISDNILLYIGLEGGMNHSNCDYSKLSYHCLQFGYHTRCLSLQNVLCVAESCQLLRNSKLQNLVLCWIRSKEHVDGLCKLLIQNSETLTSLQFIHCKLSSSFVNAICGSLHRKSMQTHGIQHFSVHTSSFLENDPVALPPQLVSFLSSGRSLCSLKFCDDHLDRNFARMVFGILLDTSSSLSILDLSENNIAGWLSNFNRKLFSGPQPALGIHNSLQSLRLLNLRGNDLRKEDADNLRFALLCVPNLENLDISDNPIQDDGIRSLIPYFVKASERCSPLGDLKLENCELSCNGVTQLLDALSTLKKPLNSLSVADNGLGSQVAAALGKFLGTSIRVLDMGGIGLGSSGFRNLQQGIIQKSRLVKINISKNRGGTETANFLSKLLSWAPELVAVDASYNLMPVESLTVICSALKVTKSHHLRCLDLTGNTWDNQPALSSMLAEFQYNGRPILILPSLPTSEIPYDDDP
ncbi:LRR_6 domain-containing protein [Cephalotus follicularis]|uniref:LRR_6 domain-containing protein n=1 Tax=Cephalotus follicularis TaxID=3775 RepID=A0A1Q3B7U6_CEPFO|nr:LRR_6 domain-containing protein [Cephalotus follicularis]